MSNNTKKRLLFVMDRWQSVAGGIQTVNRELACSIASQIPSLECVVLVMTATEAEQKHAIQNGIRLIAGQDETDWSSILLSRELEEIPAEDVLAIIGHSYFSGPQALRLRERFFRKALFVHFVHMSPFDTESLKEYRASTYVTEREKKVREELKSAEQADIVACIGPRLWTYMSDQLAARKSKAQVIRVDCGIKRAQEDRTPPIHPTLLCMGRTDSIEVKGLDIFAYAAGELTQLWISHPSTHGRPLPKFIVRGAKEDAEKLQKSLRDLSKTAGAEANIQVRPYTPQKQELEADFLGASVFTMPSREEGFGLVACEALSLGVPVLVSANSGFADALREMADQTFFSVDRCVVQHSGSPREIARNYAQAALKLLINEGSATTYAHQLREHMYPRCSWDTGARTLLAKIKQLSGSDLPLREPDPSQDGITPQATAVLRRHAPSLLALQGVASVLIRHAIVVVVEAGVTLQIPKELDGVDIVVREIETMKLTSAPFVQSGNSVLLNGTVISCVGALLVDERGSVFATTAAHAMPAPEHGLEVAIQTHTGRVAVTSWSIDRDADLTLLVVPQLRPPFSTLIAVEPTLGTPVHITVDRQLVSGIISGIDVSARVSREPDASPVSGMFEIALSGHAIEGGHSGALVSETRSGRPLGTIVARLERPGTEQYVVFAKALAPFLDKHRLSVASFTPEHPASLVASVRVGVIASSQMTLDLLLQLLNEPRRESHGGTVYFHGRLSTNGPSIYVHRLSSMGNLGAAVAAANMIRDVNPDYLFVVGAAGGLRPASQSQGDVVISSEIAYYEPAKIVEDRIEPRFRIIKLTPRWLLSIAEELAVQPPNAMPWRTLPDEHKSSPKIHIGAIASGEKLFSRSNHLEELLGGWRKVLAVEMEGAGVAEAAAFSERDLPVVAIRGIADFPQEAAKTSHIEAATANAVQVAMALARQLQEREQRGRSTNG